MEWLWRCERQLDIYINRRLRMKKCTDCKYCLQEDFGYSNYTVEGCEVNCLLKKNPHFPADRFYKEEPALSFAEKCDNFIYGDPVCVDVDHEEGELWKYSNDPKIVRLLKRWDNG